MPDLEQFVVGVTVFATVPGVDVRDAGRRLEGALQRRMGWSGYGFTLTDDNTSSTLPVHAVVEAGLALTEGYLMAVPAAKVTRESSHRRAPKQPRD